MCCMYKAELRGYRLGLSIERRTELEQVVFVSVRTGSVCQYILTYTTCFNTTDRLSLYNLISALYRHVHLTDIHYLL